MDLPEQLVRAAVQLAQSEMKLVCHTYDNLAKGPARRKLIPIYKRIDTLASGSTAKVACGNGCDFCCHYHVYVTPLEVFGIVDEVQTWSYAKREALISSVRKYVMAVKGLGKDRHRTMNIACSFLQEGSCSIYSMRPLACRRHHSADRGICERAFKNPRTTEPSQVDIHRTVVSRGMEMLHSDYHRVKGFDRNQYEYHAALLEALTDPNCRARWNRKQSAFLTVADQVAVQS
ncbi:YkgJ family cysteine cluster protein [Massilia sp. PAMC28688]|uniref:YkgJ family cysteine cluster protein n=1 Tax=Massilia sp. PAMC28688 TaxID=2861283 RepID=UPI001C630BB3|nr:YkgJ family cysteine cluster protein [Massilia sp. PAMC28688]QYF92637.1 YkgJ family cysteine cluster protein [Massilia sp. PAMC28688]